MIFYVADPVPYKIINYRAKLIKERGWQHRALARAHYKWRRSNWKLQWTQIRPLLTSLRIAQLLQTGTIYSDTVIDPVNEHRDDPANCNTTRADSGSKSKGRRTPNKKHSSSSSKKATGTNADLNYRDLGGDDEDRHREAIVLQ